MRPTVFAPEALRMVAGGETTGAVAKESSALAGRKTHIKRNHHFTSGVPAGTRNGFPIRPVVSPPATIRSASGAKSTSNSNFAY